MSESLHWPLSIYQRGGLGAQLVFTKSGVKPQTAWLNCGAFTSRIGQDFLLIQKTTSLLWLEARESQQQRDSLQFSSEVNRIDRVWSLFVRDALANPTDTSPFISWQANHAISTFLLNWIDECTEHPCVQMKTERNFGDNQVFGADHYFSQSLSSIISPSIHSDQDKFFRRNLQ